MKTVGIIAEYNPLHNGHKLHIEKSKEISKADYVIAVMSGNYVQRGEPAIIDKWNRTEMALKNGVDMVLELPVIFSSGSAEFFATGAVKTLEDTGLVNSICFGSEYGKINELKKIAHFFEEENTEFQFLLKQYLKEGLSYPSARMKACKQLTKFDYNILNSPNNILAVEYLKALIRLKSKIEPTTISREGAGYHCMTTQTQFASATAIRNALMQKDWDNIQKIVPDSSYCILKDCFSSGLAPVSLDFYYNILHYRLLTMSSNEIKEIFEVSEGLENRILHSVEQSNSLDDLVSCIKTKRYTHTKIKRILLHILLNIQSKDILSYHKKQHSPYIRVLGFRRSKVELLKKLTKTAMVPVITNLKNVEKQLDRDAMNLLELEMKATDLYFMNSPNKYYHRRSQDYKIPMVMIP